MKIQLVLGRTMNDYHTSWVDTRIFELEIPIKKQDPGDGFGDYHLIGCNWKEEGAE